MSRHQDSRPYFSGSRGAEWQLYCSICGGPLFMEGQNHPPLWLEDVLVLPMVTEQFEAIPVHFVDGVNKSASDVYIAWYDWEGWENDMPRSGLPIHKVCLGLAESVVASSTSKKPFLDGGPPSSMLDVLNVLRARLVNYTSRCSDSGMYRLPEPSEYGGIWDLMEMEGWSGSSRVAQICEMDPTSVVFDILPAQTRAIQTFKIPVEILQCIFEYAWNDEDASSVPEYFFPSGLWADHVRRMPVLKSISLPDDCDWEDLARKISKVSIGQDIPGLEALRNRMRIWKLICDMQWNDNYDIRTGLCKCEPWNGGGCWVWDFGERHWCQESWSEWQKTCAPSADYIPTMDDLGLKPVIFDDSGNVERDYWTRDGTPIPDYIVNSKKNTSFRTWLGTRCG